MPERDEAPVQPEPVMKLSKIYDALKLTQEREDLAEQLDALQHAFVSTNIKYDPPKNRDPFRSRGGAIYEDAAFGAAIKPAIERELARRHADISAQLAALGVELDA